MSTYKAIAGVSATLRNLVRDRMEDQVAVTIAPPDVTVDTMSGRRVNLYLYHVTENGYLKNQEIPGHGYPGAYGHPPLSLDLHYLLTTYGGSDTGEDADREAQEILGDAMRAMHDFAIITQDLLQERIAGTPPMLDTSLLGEFEQVKITLQPATLEEFSKIWTALPQANFRRSVAYQVSVVQIESRRSRRIAMPVKTRRVHLTTLRRPHVAAVYRTPTLPGEPIGDVRTKLLQQLTIEGVNFMAPKTWVRLGHLEPIRVAPLANDRIQIAVPDDEYPVDADHPLPRPIPIAQQLQPGPRVVEVLTEVDVEAVEGGLDLGTVVTRQVTLHSNQSVFILVPEISSVNPVSVAWATLPTALLSVTGQRLHRDGMRSVVLVGDVSIDVRPPVPPDPWAAPTETTVEVPLATFATAVSPPPPAGQPYPVRIQVNGAQSTEESMMLTVTP